MRIHVLPLWLLVFTVSCAHSASDRVTRVVDGDTVILEKIGRVRLIGVDTPETVHPQQPVEHFGKEASNFTKRMLEGRDVQVEFGWQRRDRHGRTLAYLFLEDGTFFNAELIKEGYAHAYTQFPFEYLDEFRRYEREARKSKKGLWRDSSDETDGREGYRGNSKSRVYHSPGCPHYDCKNCTLLLRSRNEAEAEGFRAHEACVEQEALK